MTCSKCQAELTEGSVPSETGVDLCPVCYQERVIYPYGSPAAVEKLVDEVKKELGFVLVIFAICSMAVYALGHWQSLHPYAPQRPQNAPAGQIRRIHDDIFVNNAPPPDASPLFVPAGTDGVNIALNFRIEDLKDVSRIHKTLALALGARGCDESPSGLMYTDTRPSLYNCLLSDLLDLHVEPYSLRLVSFEHSAAKVLSILRKELPIAPPKGRAVVRFFDSENPMPQALVTFHRNLPDVTGACFAHRFIAIFRGGADLEDVVSHELVHAYVGSALGANDSFEDWFNEGFALNIARTPVTSVLSGTPETGEFTATLTAQYREYKHVFDRLEKHLGRVQYLSTIARCIQSRSLKPLYEATGSHDYSSLKDFGNSWAPADLSPYAVILAFSALAGIVRLVGRRYARSRRSAPTRISPSE
jgi:hypothetical protein